MKSFERLARLIKTPCRKALLLAIASSCILSAASSSADVAQAPLFVAKYVPGNLALVPSVEWPTILSVANLGNYADTAVFTGYFDSGKCYKYVNSGADTSHFAPVSLTSNRRCSGANRWSGNFLNWAATQTIDPFRSALTGGYRVKDTPTETWLEKARHTGQNTSGRRNISSGVSNATAVTNWSNFYTRLDGLGARMYFARNNSNIYGSPSSVRHYDPSSHNLNNNNDNNVYEVYIRVKVCDASTNMGVGGLEGNCKQYSQGYKPEGLIQEYADQVRYSVFGYLNDENMLRDGGVLRANQKFVGPVIPLLGGGEVANPESEWDPITGVLVRNPNPADAQSTASYFNVSVNDSGVINYLNKFGQMTAHNHKSHDPVSELYYTALRYFKNQGCVPAYSTRYPSHNNNPSQSLRERWVDGFPVIEDWTDPIEHRCQKNVILGIGDVNTHRDKNLPGRNRTNDEPAMSAEVSGDDTIGPDGSVVTATDRVGTIEGVSISGTPFTGRENSAYMVGLAYDAHTRDIRPDADMPGIQTVSTHWVDVRENETLAGRSSNQYWLAAKYGGFLVPNNYEPYARTDPLPQSWWTDGDFLSANYLRPRNFYVASDAQAMVASLRTAFANIVADMQASSSSIAANSTRLDTETMIYQASFNARDWSGRIRAHTLNSDGSIDEIAWDTNDAGTFDQPDNRNIFTASGVPGATSTTGINFTWLALSEEQQELLQAADARGEDRLEWLRGDDSEEGNGGLRERSYLLGDIVNSDPAFVGNKDDFGYQWLPGTEGGSYKAFLTTKSARASMLYVGSNGGMLHGFNAADGEEVFAYVPLGVFEHLHELAAPNYQHRYFVDGSARAGDAYLGGGWKTVLLGSTGAGGRSIFALDVTNPASMGPSKLMWEFSTDEDDAHQLELAMSQPVIARVYADVGGGRRWVALFGNGYAAGAEAKLFVVDLATGGLVSVIETGIANADGSLNGLSSVVPVDINNDRITDYVYGGDLHGNLWRFDLTGTTVASWGSSLLFRALDSEGVHQPITARPAVGRHTEGGLMIYFGTGKYLEPDDAIVPEEAQVQTFYGIRDLNGAEVARANLQEQSIIFEGLGALLNEDGTTGITDVPVRAVSSNNPSVAPLYGWRLDLVPPAGTAQGERVISMPLVRFGRIIFTSILPTEDPCDFGGTSWLMELDAMTGGRLTYSALDVNNDGEINANDYITLPNGDRIPTSGRASGEMIDTPGIVSAGEIEYKYTSGSSGTIGTIRERGASDILGRQSWRQLQ